MTNSQPAQSHCISTGKVLVFVVVLAGALVGGALDGLAQARVEIHENNLAAQSRSLRHLVTGPNPAPHEVVVGAASSASMSSSAGPAAVQLGFWRLAGNNVDIGEFIGSTNNAALTFKTNGLSRMQIGAAGEVSIQSNLEVNGLVRSISGGIMYPDGSVQVTATERGPAGPPGPEGPQGPAGPQGPPGEPGSSAAWVDGPGEVRTDVKVGIGAGPRTPLDVLGGVDALGGYDAVTARFRNSEEPGRNAGIIIGVQEGNIPYIAGSDIDESGGLLLRSGATDGPPRPFLILKPNGNIGIGRPIPGFRLDVGGSIRCVGFQNDSDSRLKTSIEPVTGALEKLALIHGITFTWNEESEKLGYTAGQRSIGVLAQDVEKVFPELVSTSTTEGFKAVDYSRLTAVLIEAVRELESANRDQLKEIRDLQSDIRALQKRIEQTEPSRRIE